MEGTVPRCPKCKGVIKPDIVFFGEQLPQHFFQYFTDFPMADLLIVMGTSLEVSFVLYILLCIYCILYCYISTDYKYFPS